MIEYFDSLKDAGIVHLDPSQASSEVNSIDQDVDNWWGSSDLQKVSPPIEAPGHENHSTDFGICLPRTCVGAEAEDFAIWHARGLVAQCVYRWRVLELETASLFSKTEPRKSSANTTSHSAVCIEGFGRGLDSNTLESQLRHFVLATNSEVVGRVEAQVI